MLAQNTALCLSLHLTFFINNFNHFGKGIWQIRSLHTNSFYCFKKKGSLGFSISNQQFQQCGV